MARETPVFISYARADERYATELMQRLAAEPDIAPWQDRIKMSAGDFEEQLKAAIDSSEYFVLVMTPAALRSPWVEREWRYARTNGRCIVPIVPALDSAGSAELEALRAALPIWMQKTQTYDFIATGSVSSPTCRRRVLRPGPRSWSTGSRRTSSAGRTNSPASSRRSWTTPGRTRAAGPWCCTGLAASEDDACAQRVSRRARVRRL